MLRKHHWGYTPRTLKIKVLMIWCMSETQSIIAKTTRVNYFGNRFWAINRYCSYKTWKLQITPDVASNHWHLKRCLRFCSKSSSWSFCSNSCLGATWQIMAYQVHSVASWLHVLNFADGHAERERIAAKPPFEQLLPCARLRAGHAIEYAGRTVGTNLHFFAAGDSFTFHLSIYFLSFTFIFKCPFIFLLCVFSFLPFSSFFISSDHFSFSLHFCHSSLLLFFYILSFLFNA